MGNNILYMGTGAGKRKFIKIILMYLFFLLFFGLYKTGGILAFDYKILEVVFLPGGWFTTLDLYLILLALPTFLWIGFKGTNPRGL